MHAMKLVLVSALLAVGVAACATVDEGMTPPGTPRTPVCTDGSGEASVLVDPKAPRALNGPCREGGI